MSTDRPYDETVDVQDSEDIVTPRLPNSSCGEPEELEGTKLSEKKRLKGTTEAHLTESTKATPKTVISMKSNNAQVRGSGSSGDDDDEDEDDDDDEEDDEDDEDNTPDVIEGAYNPADYEHLAVSPEIKEMFEYIQRYTPQTIELETKLKPFLPDYIAAVGDIDAFLKVPRPDGKPDYLGLLVLDEPCAQQSDPTVLDLQLRALSKQSTNKKIVVRSIENAEHQTKAIDNWIKSITDLYRAKPPPTVHYVRNMPEISNLMAEWPTAFEDCMRNSQLPCSQLDCSLKDYVDIICGQVRQTTNEMKKTLSNKPKHFLSNKYTIDYEVDYKKIALLDIPVYNNRIHSLHLLFSLYLEFRNSQHFRQTDSNNVIN